MVLLENIQQGGSKTKITFHELFSILRTVHPSQIENKVGSPTKSIQEHRVRIKVIFHHLRNSDRIVFGLTGHNILELGTKILTDESMRPCY